MTSGARLTLSAVLAAWNDGPTARLAELLAPTYRGHMLGLRAGERDAAAYPGWIERYRVANPGVRFEVVEQFDAVDRVVSDLQARRVSGATLAPSVSHGINISRFDQSGRLAEEWAIWSDWLDDEEIAATE